MKIASLLIFALLLSSLCQGQGGTPPGGYIAGASSGSSNSGVPSQQVTPNQNAVYLSTNCGTQTNCYSVKGDVQFVADAAWTNTGTTVTTNSSDPPFVCPGASFPCSSGGDAGKIEYGTSACGTGNGNINCVSQIPQGTITTVNNAHSVTVSVAATASSTTNAAWFAWGTQDDAPAMQSAMSAINTAGGGDIYLPCNAMFIASAPFIVTGRHQYPINVHGCSQTYLMPTPGFSFASCSNGGFSPNDAGCIFVDWYAGSGNPPPNALAQSPFVNDALYDFEVWGLGEDNGAGSAHIGIAGYELFAQNVSIVGWNWNVPSTLSSPQCSWEVSSSLLINDNGWTAQGCGINVIQEGQSSNPTQIINGLYGASGKGPGMILHGGNSYDNYVITSGVSFDSAYPTATAINCGVYLDSLYAVWLSTDDASGGINLVDSTAYVTNLYNSYSNGSGFVGGGTSVLYARNSNLFNISSLASGATIYDQGGNTWGSVSSLSGKVFGNGSVTGTQATASNVTPSSGWGTTGAAGNGVSAVSGNTQTIQFTVTAAGTPTPNPTVTETFATPFLKAPICTMTDTGTGTGALPTSIVNGTPSTTSSGAFTYTGTPVAASTYSFVIQCGNP